jgi:uncharacterized damage-inducible protein DinB
MSLTAWGEPMTTQETESATTERNRLLDMMARIHSGDAWHGPSVMAALDGVDAARASAHPLRDAHSIWEIALHVIGWRREVAARARGKAPSLPEEGDWPTPGVDEAAWTATKAALDASHHELVTLVSDLPDDALERPVGRLRDAGLGAGVTTAIMLHGIVQHDAYHAGQMALLAKAARR